MAAARPTNFCCCRRRRRRRRRRGTLSSARPLGTRRAFSLVELLVLLGIIGVLLSLLLPSLRLVRQTADRLRCAEQLRHLGLGLTMYANANGGWLPAASGWHTYPEGGTPEDEPGPGWTERLTPYYGPPDSAAHRCPSSPVDPPQHGYFMSCRWAWLNRRKPGDPAATRLSDVRTASRFVLSGDATNLSLYVPPFGTSDHRFGDVDRDDSAEQALAFPDDGTEGAFLTHRGGNNVLFDDGHVAAFERHDPSAMTFHPRHMLSWHQIAPDDPPPPQ